MLARRRNHQIKCLDRNMIGFLIYSTSGFHFRTWETSFSIKFGSTWEGFLNLKEVSHCQQIPKWRRKSQSPCNFEHWFARVRIVKPRMVSVTTFVLQKWRHLWSNFFGDSWFYGHTRLYCRYFWNFEMLKPNPPKKLKWAGKLGQVIKIF